MNIMNINKFDDKRGKLLFPIQNSNLLGNITQCTISKNNKHVFRGMHCNNFDKLVTCVSGQILDIIINLNKNDDDYLKVQYFELSANSQCNQIFVPRNYAHGFLTLDEDTILVYHFNGYFSNNDTVFINYQDPYLNIELPIPHTSIIISDSDNRSIFLKPIDYILLGSTGYIGSKIYAMLKKQNKNFITINDRIANVNTIKDKLTLFNPKYVINAAGLTGKPNISWCDDNRVETIETNITYQLTLAKICNDLNIHLTVVGSGGIFNDKNIKSESDEGNSFANFYTESRIYLENIIKNYENVLYLRVNYPISADLNNERNLLYKLNKYQTICDTELSITCLDALLPLLSEIIENKEIGVFNFVNPDTINLITIKKTYNTYKHITESFDIIVDNNSRPCPILNTSRIEKYKPMNIMTSLIMCLQ